MAGCQFFKTKWSKFFTKSSVECNALDTMGVSQTRGNNDSGHYDATQPSLVETLTISVFRFSQPDNITKRKKFRNKTAILSKPRNTLAFKNSDFIAYLNEICESHWRFRDDGDLYGPSSLVVTPTEKPQLRNAGLGQVFKPENSGAPKHNVSFLQACGAIMSWWRRSVFAYITASYDTQKGPQSRIADSES